MEFRIYDKLNCSAFDLIEGDLEPKQTKALGYLFSQSKEAVNKFLKLLGKKISYDYYIVDCEAQERQKENDRIDILLRFYKNEKPILAVIIEAKGGGTKTKASKAGQQGANYNRKDFNQLCEFDYNNRIVVSITRYAIEKNSDFTSISWSQLISSLHELKKKHRLIKDFINYITKVKRSMNYFEEEVVTIPSNKYIEAVQVAGLYICPANYKEIRTSLFFAFRGERGVITSLYKLLGAYELRINDESAIENISKTIKEFKQRLKKYKEIAGKDWDVNTIYRVHILDLDNIINLPNPVRPIENNTNTTYHSLHDCLQSPNSDLDKTIILDSIFKITDDNLCIDYHGNGNIYMESCNNKGFTQCPIKSKIPLNQSLSYVFTIRRSKNMEFKYSKLTFENGTWVKNFIFTKELQGFKEYK